MTEKSGVWEGFLDELSAPQVRPCGMKKYMDTLDADTVKMVQDAGTDNEVPTIRLHRALTSRGFTKSSEVVRRHFNGACSCFRAYYS